MIKKFIKLVLKRFGIVAFKRSSRVYVPENDSYYIVAALVGRSSPVVIDGGAHRGDMVEIFGSLLPSAEFHCFEPDPILGEILAQKFSGDPRVHVFKSALGDISGKAKLNINVSRPTNSLLASAETLQPNIKELCQMVEQVEVEIVTVDEFCRANSIDRVDVLKLDLQGYDYMALLGAGSALETARVVLVEVLFNEIYQGCHLFPDILQLMIAKGFKLHTLCGLHYGEGDELLWADAIFVKAGPVVAPTGSPSHMLV